MINLQTSLSKLIWVFAQRVPNAFRYDKSLNIEVISENEPDHQLILKGREERKINPENYGTIDDIDWN